MASQKTTAPTIPLTRLIKVKQAARETGVPYGSLRDAHFRGELTVVKVGRAWYVERRDIDQWIDARKERAAS